MDDERAHLYEIIRAIGAGPDLDTILEGVVRLATEATHCHACLIWFLDEHRSVLRVASAPYDHLGGTIEMAAGEGLVGWVAKTRQAAYIRDRALEDPRVKYVPEFDEEDFQSLVAVPVFGRDGAVMAVISLHAEAPHEFARMDVDLLEHTGTLMAGAIENARLFEESAARVDLLTDLSRLSQRVAAAGTTEDLLRAVTQGTRNLLTAERCEIYMTDRDGSLRLAAASPPRIDATGSVFDQELWVDEAGSSLLTPVAAGDERIGLLAVMSPAPPPGAAMTLQAIAAHTAVAIRQQQLVERLLEKNLVRDFFQDLAAADGGEILATSAAKLGFDLDAPHAVVHVVARADPGSPPGDPASWHDVSARVESQLVARFPGALLDRPDDAVRALVPLPQADPGLILEELAVIAGEANSSLGCWIGVSPSCRGSRAYPAALGQAEAAAEIGGMLRGAPGVTVYDDLGAYRYILGASAEAQDRDQRRLERLVAYDRRRGTELLNTLEAYLDRRGNVVGTARALFIHPNTLRQRLERVEREAGIDLERDDWLSLAVALKVVKLRLMRGSLEREGGAR